MYVVLNQEGAPVSFGTVVADPLPEGHTSRPLAEAEEQVMSFGPWSWADGAVVPVETVSVATAAAAALAALTADESTADPAIVAAIAPVLEALAAS
jgi:hypothetical protein